MTFRAGGQLFADILRKNDSNQFSGFQGDA